VELVAGVLAQVLILGPQPLDFREQRQPTLADQVQPVRIDTRGVHSPDLAIAVVLDGAQLAERSG